MYRKPTKLGGGGGLEKPHVDIVIVGDKNIPNYVKGIKGEMFNCEFNENGKMINVQPILPQPNDEIWYTSTDGNIVEPVTYDSSASSYIPIPIGSGVDAFGANIVSNTYVDGKGIIKFDGDVTSIGNYAFENCSNLTSITIPNSVTSIGDFVFQGCSSLTSITIPNFVTSIGIYAFENCSNLTSVTMNNSVTNIGGRAFSNCSSLTSINIPDSVTSIGNSAFYNCSSLPVIDNIRYADTCLVEVVDKTLSTYSIKEETIFIIGCLPATLDNTSAFHGCSNLTSITIPNSVTSIGDYAFENCSNLTSITIPNSVTNIGNGAFGDCSSLTLVTISNSVTSIGNYAFENCSNLTSVTIPNSVTNIGGMAFSNCSSLTSVTIPNSVTNIGSGAFMMCTAKIIFNTLYSTFNNNLFNITATITPVTNIEFNVNSIPEEYDVTILLSKGAKKTTVINNIFTDNAIIKSQCEAFADQYTTMIIKHIDGSDW